MADTQVEIFFLGIFMCFPIITVLGLVIAHIVIDRKPENEESLDEEESFDVFYPSPVLKELSPEQIEDIHSRGKITPAEYVEQWKSLDMCWVISEDIAAPRCERFRNCHDCFVDLANKSDEHTSLLEYIKLNQDI